MGYRGIGHMGNEAHRGKVVQGYGHIGNRDTGANGYGGMGHMGNEAHRGYGVQEYEPHGQ